ncbi:MAG: MBL fold metallo-hydrolase, partial [Clostridiales bacterium]|nr:MBL fold metallo-hydrolase [Clostridiales bacterium]
MSQQDAKWNDKPKGATKHTKQYQQTFAKSLNIDLENATNEELELAASHCIYKTDNKKIPGKYGKYVWNLEEYQFLKEEEVPDTINPSLWLNAKSNYQAGLFEVVKDKIYQVRGYDLANITFVRSKTGFIILDTGSCVEGAAAALETAEEGLHENIRDNIRAVIISHSHSDHYGGVGAFVSRETAGYAEDGKIPVIVPGGFDKECVSESVYAGTAMHRRGIYQFASGKKPGIRSVVSAGLGLSGNASAGNRAYIAPTIEITKDTSVFIDGLEVEFQLTPGTEAPAEMNNYFPEYRAFWAAENCTATLHNFYPIRGAKVRDSSIWADFTIAALERYGNKTDVVFQSHHWPHWNTAEHPAAVKDYLRNSAVIYKYIHDQTLFYANQGYTPNEIAHKIDIPSKLLKAWYIRPYYGTVEVNAKAVYQRYLG